MAGSTRRFTYGRGARCHVRRAAAAHRTRGHSYRRFPLAGWNEGFYLRSDDKSYELHLTGQLQSTSAAFPKMSIRRPAPIRFSFAVPV